MLMLESVFAVSEITVMSFLYYSRKVLLPTGQREEIHLHCKSPVYIGKVGLDIFMKFSENSVTLTSQDNLSNRRQGRDSVVRRP